MSWAELVSAEDAYMADLDGDGKKEIILCGYYGGNGLNFSIEIWRESEEGTGKFIREEFFPEDIDHYTWQLWFEEFDGKIYTFRLEKLDGSLDCFLNVELIQDNKLYPVMNYFLLDNKVCRYEKADPELYTSYR